MNADLKPQPEFAQISKTMTDVTDQFSESLKARQIIQRNNVGLPKTVVRIKRVPRKPSVTERVSTEIAKTKGDYLPTSELKLFRPNTVQRIGIQEKFTQRKLLEVSSAAEYQIR